MSADQTVKEESGFAIRCKSNGGAFLQSIAEDWDLQGDERTAEIFDTEEQAREHVEENHMDDASDLELVPITRTVNSVLGKGVAL